VDLGIGLPAEVAVVFILRWVVQEIQVLVEELVDHTLEQVMDLDIQHLQLLVQVLLKILDLVEEVDLVLGP
jgi:hypothetical protein